MPHQDITGNNLNRLRIVLKNGQAITDAHEAATDTIASLDTALLANGFTQAKLDCMTKNDKTFAYRNLAANATAIGN